MSLESLSRFDVVLCVRVEAPEHVNIEEAKALFAYVLLIFRPDMSIAW